MDIPPTDQMTATIFAGGHLIHHVDVESSDLVIAVDSGYDTARSVGVEVDAVVGDMDSITDEGLREATNLGVTIRRYPVEKDLTDLELALDAAIEMGSTDITVLAGEGGRFDHLIGIALLLTATKWADVTLTWRMGNTTAHRVLPHHPLSITVPSGTTVTLHPVGDTHGVNTKGLRWALTDATLSRGSSRGISNVAIQSAVFVSITEGALLLITIQETEVT